MLHTQKKSQSGYEFFYDKWLSAVLVAVEDAAEITQDCEVQVKDVAEFMKQEYHDEEHINKQKASLSCDTENLKPSVPVRIGMFEEPFEHSGKLFCAYLRFCGDIKEKQR